MKALIIGNGRFDNIISNCDYDIIICADGGFNNAIENDIKPDIVIGDFDSIEENNLYFNNVREIIRNADQDTTDIEKALIYCLENNYFDVTIAAVTGLRNDHFLYNLYLLNRFYKKFNNIKIIDQFQVITATDFRIDFFERMGYLSVFSLTEAVIRKSSGLLYPLDNIKIGGNTGIQSQSNVVSKKRAFIEVESGEIIVFLPFEYLNNFKIKKRIDYDTTEKIL